jgi:Protein of unknown function (DUF3025)
MNAVDWSQPWFGALAGIRAFVSTPDPIADLNRCAAERRLATATGRPLEFVAADDAPPGHAYEAHIAATGRVPTRLNRHDLFNALVWLAFPRTKARLNALQADAIARDGVGGQRGPLRDAATLFDENGALLVTADATLPALLRERRWKAAFVDRRGDWDTVRVLVFGHALMDKLTAPYKAITAHALVVGRPADAPLAEVDAALAPRFDGSFDTSTLLPLPVLGVPGGSANANPIYYDDATVFRPAKAGRRTPQECSTP